MGSQQSAVQEAKASVKNETLQESKNDCYIGCVNISSGDTIMIVDSKIGDLNFNQECKMENTTCVMSSSFDTNVSTILESSLSQSNSAFAGLNLSFNAINQRVRLEQYLENSISQIMENSCNITARNERENLFLYVQNSETGDLNFSQTGNMSNSDCNLTNTASIVVANEVTSKIEQTAKIVSLGMALLLVIIIAVVLVVVFKGGKGGKGGKSKNNDIQSFLNTAAQNTQTSKKLK